MQGTRFQKNARSSRLACEKEREWIDPTMPVTRCAAEVDAGTGAEELLVAAAPDCGVGP